MSKRRRKVPAPSTAADGGPESAGNGFTASNLSLHDLFQQQIRTMLDGTDLGEEQKQEILLAASCPCCGAGGMSFTAPIKRRS